MGFSVLEMENEGDLGLYICIPKQPSSSRDMLSNNVDLYRVDLILLHKYDDAIWSLSEFS